MNDADRFRLVGKYKTPRFRHGPVVWCEVRGEVTICAITEAPIPWPVGKKGRARSLVVYKGLARAVRTESAQAVAHWWGVTPQTVTVWRKALGVPETNADTSRLRSEYAQEPWAAEARGKARDKAGDPERRREIAEARRGKPRPPHVIEEMRKGRTGKSHGEETRARMRAAHRRRKEWGG
jgi:hypothetical protein